MKIIIDIPEEFEIDFKNDRFDECFERVITDIENMRTLLSGNYEAETLEMLRKAFKEVIKVEDVANEIWMHSVEEKIPSCCTHRIIDADEAIELLGYERIKNK